MVGLDIRHYCATLLHLDYRSLRGYSKNKKGACHCYVREQLQLIGKPESSSNSETQQNKRQKLEHSFILDEIKDESTALDQNEFDDDYDAESVEYSLSMTQADELRRYLSMKIDMNHKFFFDVLTFRKSDVNK